MRDSVVDRLATLRRRLRMSLLIEGIARTLASAVGLALVTALLDHRMELSRPTRLVVLLVSLGVIGYLLHRFVIKPMRSPMSPLDLSAALDRCRTNGARSAVLPDVAAVMELPGMLGRASSDSADMIRLAVKQSYETLSQVDFQAHADRRHQQRWSAALVGVVLLPILLSLVMPDTASIWARRWLLGSNQPWPRSTSILLHAVEDGVLIVPRGEAVVLRAGVTDTGRTTESVWMSLRHADGRKESVTFTRFADGDFRYDLPPLQNDATVRLFGGDGRTGMIDIQPHDRPRVTSMTLSHRAPHDTEATEEPFTGRHDLSLFNRAHAELSLQTNVPVTDVRVDTQKGAPLSFLAQPDGSVSTSWVHEQALQAKLRLSSAESGLLSHPIPLSIGLKQDRPPRASLRFSGVRQRVTSRVRIPLTLEARDDLGVRALAVHVTARAPGSGPSESDGELIDLFGPESPTSEKLVQSEHTLEVTGLDLSPGALLTLEGEAHDDHFAGPQSAYSRKVVFSIVTDEELFREILLRQQGLRAAFRKAKEQAQALHDMLAGKEEADDPDAMSRRFRVLRREVWQTHRDLQASATEMRLNQLGGPEAYELIDRYVLTPMQRLHDQDMDRQREALASLSLDDADAVSSAADRQALIVEQMEEILSQMRQWDSFIDVINQLDEIIKLQKGAHEDTDSMRKEQLESIFDE